MADFEHTYTLNKTLYKVNNRFRYLRTLQDKSGMEDIIVDSIGLTEKMINILSYFNEKRTKLDIINFLIKEYDVSLEEGTAFAEELINEQVICPELQPNITGKDFMYRGKNITSNLTPACSGYMAIRHGLNGVAKSPLSKITGNIIKFEQQINDILHFKDTGKCSIYLNMERKCRKGGPDLSWQSKILDGMYVLGKIVPAYENENLCRFKERFGEKFNLRWTPL